MSHRPPAWISLTILVHAAAGIALATPGLARSAPPQPRTLLAAPAAPTGQGMAPSPRCLDEESDLASATDAAGAGEAATPAPGDARKQLQTLVAAAIQRSQIVGATQLLADAAKAEIDEARAAGLPSANATLLGGMVGSDTEQTEVQRGKQVRAGVNLNWVVFDFGRVERLTQWRTQLAEAARLARLSAEEQVAAQTIALALERQRHKLQVRVNQQYARKMSCLVDALEQVVAADRGRASELVQARKTLLQAELARTQGQDAVRQSEIRLRRFVGEAPLPTENPAALLARVPELAAVQAEAERAAELAQLAAQGDAAERLAAAVVAGQKPQVALMLNASKAKGVGSPTAWTTGLTLHVPLLSPADDASATAAQKRAAALRAQWTDALEARRARAADAHDQALSAFERARRTVEVLRESDRMRGATLQQWRQLGRRSLFDVMSAESEHYALRAAHVNALVDGQQATALLLSLGAGLQAWLQ